MSSLTTLDARHVDRALTVFYAVVALIALAGQTSAAEQWLGWNRPSALAAVAAVEFGGIVLSLYADHRRQLGERALAAQTLSASVAAGAVAVNWFGHVDVMQGGFFAGMSALGYLVWLLHSGARRRDQLRHAGTLPPVAPTYGAVQWLRHPGLTRHARRLALVDPTLGLYGSLDAARTARRVAVRQAAIATALRRKLTAAVDATTAEIATATYDLDEIARRLAAGADYDGLTALIAADLNPARLSGQDQPAAVETEQGDPVETPSPRKSAASKPGPMSAESRVRAYRRRHPGASQSKAASALKLSLRTVGRYWSAAEPVETASDRPEADAEPRPDTTPARHINGTEVPQLVTT